MPDDEKWYEDHDGWMGQFNEMVNEALNVDPEEPLDDMDEMAISDIAAKLANGKISLLDAIRKTMEWVAGRRGIKLFPDEETMILEAQVMGMVEITDHWKILMLQCGEPGIADAVGKLFASPSILINGPGDVADIANPPGIAAACKGWFEMAHMNRKEVGNFQWATEQALKMVLESG